MRSKPSDYLESCRVKTGRFKSDARYGNNGCFLVKGPERHKLFCIVSDMGGWEHVSVSLAGKARLPNWTEMCFVKDLFWNEDEAVVQIHPKKEDYINFQAVTLHLWRPADVELPLPPHTFVGPKNVEEGLDLLAQYTGRKPVQL